MARTKSPRKPSHRGATPRWLKLHVAIEDIEPPIWRRIGVPDRLTLQQLHRVIQLAFGWLDYHLYEFQVGDRRFEEPGEEAEGEDATRTRLSDLGLGPGTSITYTYDFGDNWVHRIRVEASGQAADATELPAVLDGARAGPPEDAGGPGGYQRLVEALKSPSDPEHDEMRMWVGDSYDSERIDVWLLDRAVKLATGWGAI